MKVAVLAGGRSSEHEVSRNSAASVSDGLLEGGHEVLEVLLERDGGWMHKGEALALTPGGGLLGADVVFAVLHGPFGEDGTVQGLLELLDVPYVGAGVLASALCMDKVVFKEVMAAAGVPQVPYAAVRHARWSAEADAVLDELSFLGAPLFVKPARLGSSVGISRVGEGGSELRDALELAFTHDGLVIVEGFSPGLEVECSVIGLSEPDVSLPGEIALTGAGWYDYEAKYTPGAMELVVPARLPEATIERVRELARETFVRAGCAGLARVDFFVEDERVLVNELNTLPGFTQTSVFPKLWEATGVPFPVLVDRLLGYAVERFEIERAGHAY